MPWTRVVLLVVVVAVGFGVLLLLSIAAGEAFVLRIHPG
jgi:hypothetical protein